MIAFYKVPKKNHWFILFFSGRTFLRRPLSKEFGLKRTRNTAALWSTNSKWLLTYPYNLIIKETHPHLTIRRKYYSIHTTVKMYFNRLFFQTCHFFFIFVLSFFASDSLCQWIDILKQKLIIFLYINYCTAWALWQIFICRVCILNCTV